MLNPPYLPRRAILYLGLSPAGVVLRSRLFGGDTRAGMHCAVLCCAVLYATRKACVEPNEKGGKEKGGFGTTKASDV